MTFSEYLRTFKSTWGAASAVVTAGPMALFAAGLCPPLWESDDGRTIAALATMAGIVGLTIAFFQRFSIAKRRRRGANALLLALPGALILVVLWSTVILAVTQTVDGQPVLRRFIIGFVLTPKYRGHAYDARDAFLMGNIGAWESWSVVLARLAVLCTVMAMIFLLSYGFGTLQTLSKPASAADESESDPGR